MSLKVGFSDIEIENEDTQTFLRAPIGSMIHFSSFYDDSVDETREDVWGVMLDRSGWWRSVDIFTGPARGRFDTDTTDHGVVVPEKDVPDEIWVALATWRLTNG